MNKLFSLILIISLLSQTIHAELDPTGLTDQELQVKINEQIESVISRSQTCIEEILCKGADNVSTCQKTVNDSLQWMLEGCFTVEYIRTKTKEEYNACLRKRQEDKTKFKMTQVQLFVLQTDEQCQLSSVESSAKMLSVFGLVLFIFLMI